MGSMKNLNDDAFQDAFMVAHEIGHSLGSGKRENRSSNSSSTTYAILLILYCFFIVWSYLCRSHI